MDDILQDFLDHELLINMTGITEEGASELSNIIQNKTVSDISLYQLYLLMGNHKTWFLHCQTANNKNFLTWSYNYEDYDNVYPYVFWYDFLPNVNINDNDWEQIYEVP